MRIVDSHCHASPYYFEPVELLLFQMDRVGVEKAVLTQHSGNVNNWYLIECARRFPGRFTVVGRISTDREDASVTLEQWQREGMVGVRFRPVTRSPGRDSLAIWRKVAELGLVVSCIGSEAEFASAEFRHLVEQLPELIIIIEHLGRASSDEEPPYTLFREVLALAKYPNVYIKVGGLGEICHRPIAYDEPMQFEKIPPFVAMIYEAFGSRRMMWCSDYPPVSYREGYANAFRFLLEHMTFCPQEDKEWIFGKTALSVFPFTEPALHPRRGCQG